MRILSLLIICSLLYLGLRPGHPHGPDFRISCSKCHSTKDWKLDKEIYSFDHNTTKLPLTGQHAKVNCRLCHPTLLFSDAKAMCIDCHSDIHSATAGSDCSRCHTPESWLVNNINEIHQMSRFPLLGAHRNADCISCHKSETAARFDVMGINCIDCHRQQFLSTTKPSHVEAGFSEDCSACHPINSMEWEGAGFNHNFFALVLGHSTPTCTDCHTTGSYSDASPACYSCHQQDYMASANPDHSASNFPVTCEACHTLNPGWKPASFDHSAFPLTLGHATPSCVECHKSGYTNTPTACFSCHDLNYNNAVNPNHKSLSFSTNCTQCHTTNPDWKPATYTQHDALSFPIYSGKHRGEWNSCTQCHPNLSNYAQFSCITCHEHNKADMDSEHSGENGYSYDSAACFKCHPRGNAD